MLSALCDQFDWVNDDTVCRHCGKVVKNKGGNTSNLMANLKTKQFYRVKKYRYYRYFVIYRCWFFSISQQPKIKLNVFAHTTLLIIATLRTGGGDQKQAVLAKKNHIWSHSLYSLAFSLTIKIEHSWCWHACMHKEFQSKTNEVHHALRVDVLRLCALTFKYNVMVPFKAINISIPSIPWSN